MKRLSTHGSAILVILAQPALLGLETAALAAPKSSEGQLRDWTPEVSVARRQYYEMGTFFDIPALKNGTPGNVGSPDGRHFFTLSTVGDLGCSCNRSRLEVYDAAQVQNWLLARAADRPRPVRAVVMNSLRHGEAIRNITWAEEGRALMFLGVDGTNRVAYRIKLPSGELEQLSNDRFPLAALPATRHHTVVYQRLVPARAPQIPIIAGVPRNDLGYVAYSRGGETTSRSEMVARFGREEPWVIAPEGEYPLGNFTFSPDGTKVIATSGFSGAAQDSTIWLVDFQRRRLSKITKMRSQIAGDAGLQPSRRSMWWSTDGAWVLMVGVGLPGAHSRPLPTEKQLYIIAYHIASGRWQKLQTLEKTGSKLRSVGWLTVGEELLIGLSNGGKPVNGAAYRLVGDTWVAQSVAPETDPLPAARSEPLVGGLEISVKQGPNDPATIIASAGGYSKPLTDPDPALRNVWRARVEPFQWSMPDGKEITGGLLLPRKRQVGKPLPLVILAGQSGYDAKRFVPEGSAATGFAAQAMAARGMAVLLLNYQDLVDYSSLQDRMELVARQGFVEAIDRAVEGLASQRIVDRNLVGVVGFSRSGLLANYLSTHPGRIPIAAVSVNDANTGGYSMYVDNLLNNPLGEKVPLETVYNGSPWEHMARWQADDPQLNPHRMKAATLYVIHLDDKSSGQSKGELQYEDIAMISGTERYRRKSDTYFISTSAHNLDKPGHWWASMRLNTDWMDFWLNGHEDPAPEKAEQYTRWRMLKERQTKFDAAEATKAK